VRVLLSRSFGFSFVLLLRCLFLRCIRSSVGHRGLRACVRRVGDTSALVTLIRVLFCVYEWSCHVHSCSLHSAHANLTIKMQLYTLHQNNSYNNLTINVLLYTLQSADAAARRRHCCAHRRRGACEWRVKWRFKI